MEYLIAYTPSTDTFTVEDVFSERKFTERGRVLPTNAPTGTDIPLDLKESKLDTVKEEVLPSFFLLPLEVRLVIYSHCLVTPLPRAYNIHNLGHQLTLDLLLVNQQVYSEARLIPFRQNVFDFDKWNGTGLFYCQSFVHRLQSWQRVNVRNIKLNVLAVTLTSETGVERWLALCREFSCSGRKDEGLKILQLTISGCFTKWKESFHLSAPWVACGLLKLRSLQSLDLTVVSESVDLALLTSFISNVQSRLQGVKIAFTTVARGKPSTLYFGVFVEAISTF